MGVLAVRLLPGHDELVVADDLDAVRAARWRYFVNTDRFDDPNLPGEMRNTITLRPVVGGSTELQVVQEGIPSMIPEEMCYLGWQESLTLLAQLVEAEIPDNP